MYFPHSVSLAVRQVLGLGDSAFYREYRDLNRKVLKPAIAQANEFSDIHLALAPPKREFEDFVQAQGEDLSALRGTQA